MREQTDPKKALEGKPWRRTKRGKPHTRWIMLKMIWGKWESKDRGQEQLTENGEEYEVASILQEL
jgi:hypothetical protein